MTVKIIVLIMLLVFSAFFSGSETALFSLDTLKLRKIKRRSKNIKNISALLQNPVRLLATILIGNMIVNITASSIAASIAIELVGDKGIGLSIGIMTFLLLIFGEVTPKRYAIERVASVSLFCSSILPYISKLFAPVHWVLHHGINRFLPSAMKEPTLNEEELKMLIDIGHKEGIVAGHEKDLIGAVLGFTDTIVKQVMTKKEKIEAISTDVSHLEFVNLAKKFKHSKIPVYRHSLDTIMGIVYSKELFLYPDKNFSEIIKPVLYVPETKKIKDLLRMFEDQNIKIAIVLDGYGKTVGLITMEDILEEVFGEIYDEFEILNILEEEKKEG
jgi:Mg2+/Co2+ transporter CorB